MACCRCHRCPNCSRLEQRHVKERINLELQYTDKKHEINLSASVSSSLKFSIETVTEDVLRLLLLDDISPKDIKLVGYTSNQQYCVLGFENTQRTLEECGIKHGDTLHFEPKPDAPPPKLCHLRIIGPNEKDEIYFEWYRAKTTLRMLLEYVIEKFSLQSVDRGRIHLLTLFDELKWHEDADKRLCLFNLHDGMAVYIQVMLSTVETNRNVRVECINDVENFVLTVSNKETIGQLKNKIKERCEGRDLIDFKMHNEAAEEIYTNDVDRTLKCVGIKDDQTLHVNFRLAHVQKVKPSAADNAIEPLVNSYTSSNANEDQENIIVKLQFPSNEIQSFKRPVRYTVGQLLKDIDNVARSKQVLLSSMRSDNIAIDFNKQNEKTRCFADLGFKPGDTLNVIMVNKPSSHKSIISEPLPQSFAADDCNKTPIGLNNLGNSCYMNSALQCLAHIQPLTDFFLNSMDRADMNDNVRTINDWNPFNAKGDIIGAYAELIWNLWGWNDNDDGSFRPERIKMMMGKKDPRFNTTNQEDAQEFMSCFLDSIEEELKRQSDIDGKSIIKNLFFANMTSTITCTVCQKSQSTSHPISFLSIPLNQQERTFWIKCIYKDGKDDEIEINVPIVGHVSHVVRRFCKAVRNNNLYHYIHAMLPDGEVEFTMPLSNLPTDELILMEHEEPTNNDIPVRLNLPSEKPTLQNCLTNFFSSEVLETKWTCSNTNCKRTTTPKKQLRYATLPQVLIIQFKRFSHESGLHQKVQTFVEYPIEGLDLRKFAHESFEDEIYDLIAVCSHTGSVFAGHYIAYAKHRILDKTDWYRFDDSCVTLVKPEDVHYDVLSRNAYLLFYAKRSIMCKETAL